MTNRWDETWHRLREWTNGQAPSERMAAQILLDAGYEALDPSHPLGGRDGGKDAVCSKKGKKWIMAVYFPRGQKDISEIRSKFEMDLAGTRVNDAVGIAFVTNQELRLAEREDLQNLAGKIELDLFHLERITAVLDKPSMAGVRQQFLKIESIGSNPVSELDIKISKIQKHLEDSLPKKSPCHKHRDSGESITSRFIHLFETQGVHRNQIPRYFGHGIRLQDVQDDALLLAKLDEVVLEAVCARFAVRREWLDGAESQVHPCQDFYKYPQDFVQLIKNLKKNNPDGDFSGVLLAPIENEHNAEALLILQESVGLIGEKPIYRYHLCNNWRFSYWKARAYLTACIAIAWKHDIFVHGTYTTMKTIEKLSAGEALLGWDGEGIWSFGTKRWDPEDMALRPDAFLHGIDPEQDNFAIKAALRLWLDLEQEGLMDAGLNKNARPLFEKELAKYKIKS